MREGGPAASQVALVRGLGRADVAALTLNMVGAGIFTLPAALAAGAGDWSVPVLLVVIGLVALMALCLVEVASRYETTGGPMVYAGAAFGPLAGFVIGWLMYLSRLSAFGAIAAIMLDYASGLWPAVDAPVIRVVAITLCVAALTAVNLRSVVSGARVSTVLAYTKLLPLVALVTVGLLLTVGTTSLQPLTPVNVDSLGGALLVALFACVGFEAPTIMTGEARSPRRDLPAGILGGVACVGMLYTLLLFVAMRTVPDLAHARRPLADAAATLVGPLGGPILAVTAMLSCAGTLAMGMVASPRLLYALAEQGDLPRVLGRVSANGRTPAPAILTSAVLVWILTVSGTFIYLATFSALARLLTYASTCAALVALRRREGPAPTAVPLGTLWAALALAASAAALAATSGTAVRDLAISAGVGLVIRIAVRSRRHAVVAAAGPAVS